MVQRDQPTILVSKRILGNYCDLSALLEHITISLVVITGCPWLAVYIRYIMRRNIQLKRRQTLTIITRLLTAELTSFGGRIFLVL